MNIEDAPQWLLDMLPKGRRRDHENAGEPVVELDTEAAIARATRYLIDEAPELFLGNGSDQGTYKIAAHVRDLGISQAMCFDLMAEHWNETKSNPPWPLEKLEFKVANAYRYATGAWGGDSALADFDPVEILEPPKKTGRPRIYRVPFGEAAAGALKQAGQPLIKGLLNQQSMMVLYGPSNSGKTFLMLDWAFHVAAGRPWQGRKVERGAVLYIAAEGGRGIYARIAALKQHYGVEDAPLDLVPCPVNLLSSKADIAAVLDLCRESENAHGLPLRMVVVDTTSRALAGGDENASTDMGAYVRNIDRIRDATAATIANVHHSGKDLARGARGWSGLRAATDTEIEIADGTVRVVKQRDMEPARDFRFTLTNVPIGKDDDGGVVSSCVVRVTTASEFARIELSPAAETMWEAFQIAAKDKAENPTDWRAAVVSTEAWEASYLEDIQTSATHKNGKRPATSARQMRDLRKTVQESGFVKKVDVNQWVATAAE